MIKIIMALLISNSAFAKGTGGTTGISSSEVKGEMSTQEFASRFQVSGDLFVTSADGKRLVYKIAESRTGKPAEDTLDVYSNWGHTHLVDGKTIGIFIRYAFQIQKDASVKVHVQQYDAMNSKALSGEVKYGKLIREEHFDLIDFAPVNWLAYQDSKMRIVARITPLLLEKGKSYGPENLPIAMEKATLIDSSGRLWGDGFSGSGKYVAVATRNGTLAISYYPFKGAEEIGVAKSNELIISKIKPSLTLRSTQPFFTATGEMKVYGFVHPQRKTAHLNSIHLIVTDKEEEFIQGLK